MTSTEMDKVPMNFFAKCVVHVQNVQNIEKQLNYPALQQLIHSLTPMQMRLTKS